MPFDCDIDFSTPVRAKTFYIRKTLAEKMKICYRPKSYYVSGNQNGLVSAINNDYEALSDRFIIHRFGLNKFKKKKLFRSLKTQNHLFHRDPLSFR